MTELRVPSPLHPVTDAIVRRIIGVCIDVHRELGPGFLERVYGRATCHEFRLRGIPYEAECPIPVRYKGALIAQHRIDFLVDRQVVVEIKAVERIAPVHVAPVIGYLRAADLRVALLVNFQVSRLKDGIRRVVL